MKSIYILLLIAMSITLIAYVTLPIGAGDPWHIAMVLPLAVVLTECLPVAIKDIYSRRNDGNSRQHNGANSRARSDKSIESIESCARVIMYSLTIGGHAIMALQSLLLIVYKKEHQSVSNIDVFIALAITAMYISAVLCWRRLRNARLAVRLNAGESASKRERRPG